MNSKIILLSVAVIAVGLFVLPSTMSLFTGQHTWYSGENVQCKKCHQDVYDEISGSQNQAHSDAAMTQCERCHKTAGWGETGANITVGQWRAYTRTNTSDPLTNTLKGGINVTAHAAVTVECLACHGTGATKYNASKSISGVAWEIQGASEAHKAFYYESVSDKEVGDINQSSLKNIYPNMATWYDTAQPNQSVIKLKGTNTACIGCHTHAIVNITWQRSVGYGINVVSNTSTGSLDIVSWNINSTTKTSSTAGE